MDDLVTCRSCGGVWLTLVADTQRMEPGLVLERFNDGAVLTSIVGTLVCRDCRTPIDLDDEGDERPKLRLVQPNDVPSP